MKFAEYYRDAHNFSGLSIGLFLNLLAWSLLAWRVLPLNESVVLHYNIYFGADYLGPSWQALYLPILGLGILLANFLIGWAWWQTQKIVAYSLNYLSAFLQLLLLVAAVLIVLANV